TLKDILDAPDCDDLIDWLRHQPLLFHDKQTDYVVVHAGFAPAWSFAQASVFAKEVEIVLQSDQATEFFHHMYGNQPDRWQDDLTSYDRLRCIVNHFTRMRLCYPDGRLDLNYKG